MQVLVTWEEIFPITKETSSTKEASPARAIIISPGWPLKIGPVRGMRKVGEAFANTFSEKTYLIYTCSRQNVEQPMYYHAQAICKFLAEKKLKSIIFVGHSQGGIKSIDVATQLQHVCLDIHVEGLILINSSGLNDIDKWTFLRLQVVDLNIKTCLAIIKESALEPSLQKKFRSLVKNIAIFCGASEFFRAIWIDIKPSPRAFLSRFKSEVIEGTTKSPQLEKVEAPVIIIQGEKDHSFNTDKVLVQSSAQINSDFKTEDFSVFNDNKYTKVLVENLFPHSPYCGLPERLAVSYQKVGHHT
jgi:pimeloyl-ACP methyl ester carboxylesterase